MRDFLGVFIVGAAKGDGIHSGARRGDGGLDADLGTILAMMLGYLGDGKGRFLK